MRARYARNPMKIYSSRTDDDGYEVVEYAPPSARNVRAAIKAAVAGFQKIYGPRLAQVWLYGSRATGEHSPDSDVDLLVVLHSEYPMHVEAEVLRSVANPIRGEYGVFVDAQPTTLEQLLTGDDDYHHFIRKEGHRVDV